MLLLGHSMSTQPKKGNELLPFNVHGEELAIGRVRTTIISKRFLTLFNQAIVISYVVAVHKNISSFYSTVVFQGGVNWVQLLFKNAILTKECLEIIEKVMNRGSVHEWYYQIFILICYIYGILKEIIILCFSNC